MSERRYVEMTEPLTDREVYRLIMVAHETRDPDLRSLALLLLRRVLGGAASPEEVPSNFSATMRIAG